MAFVANEFVIDRVRRVTEVDLASDMVNWTATQIENPQVEFTGESIDKTDARGTLIARFDTTKGVTFSAENSLLSAPMMAAQLGAEVEVASEEKKVSGETFQIVTVEVDEDGNKVAELRYEPSVAPAYVYVLAKDKNIESKIAVGAEEGNASISGKVVTLPEGFEGKQIGVKYKFEATNVVKIVDSSEKFAEAAKYIVDVLVADVCNPSIKRAASLVFPKAKIDANFSVNLTTEGTHPFSFTALKDYCDENAALCYWLFAEND